MTKASRNATSVAFGDVVRLSKERTQDPDADGFDRYVGLDHLDPGDLRIRRWGAVADGTTFSSIFHPGQVLFGKRRAYQRKVAVANFDGVCSGDIYVLESKDPDVLLPQLVPILCQTQAFFEHAVGTSAGSLSPRTNWDSLSSFEFKLPEQTEQQRIISAAAAVGSLEEELRTLLHQGRILADRFRIDSVNAGNERAVPLTDVCALRGGAGFGHSFQGHATGELPFIKVSDMNLPGNEKLMRRAQNYVTKEQARTLKARVMPPGSVVFAKVGAALRKNRRRILAQASCIDNNMMAAIPDESRIVPGYLYLLLLGIDLRSMVQEGVVPSVNQSMLGSIKVPAPSLEQQKETVARWDLVEAMTVRCSERLMAVTELRQHLVNVAIDHV